MNTPTTEPTHQEELTHIVLDPILPKHWLINKTTAEIEELAIREANETSPKYARNKQIKRRGYAKYRFLAGFSITIKGRRVKYKPKWISIKLPIMYNDKGRVKTRIELELLKEEEIILKKLLTFYSILGGKLNTKLWIPKLQVNGNYQYLVVDGKWVKLKGEKGVLLVAIGVTREGRRAILDYILTKEEDTKSYWKLLAEVWRKFKLHVYSC